MRRPKRSQSTAGGNDSLVPDRRSLASVDYILNAQERGGAAVWSKCELTTPPETPPRPELDRPECISDRRMHACRREIGVRRVLSKLIEICLPQLPSPPPAQRRTRWPIGRAISKILAGAVVIHKSDIVFDGDGIEHHMPFTLPAASRPSACTITSRVEAWRIRPPGVA